MRHYTAVIATSYGSHKDLDPGRGEGWREGLRRRRDLGDTADVDKNEMAEVGLVGPNSTFTTAQALRGEMRIMGREIYIAAGVRTAIGDYGSALKDIPPSALAAACIREAISRAKVEPKEIGQVVFGHVIHTEPRDMYLSRVAAVEGGISHAVPCLTLNRLCGSGLQAVISAAQSILLEDCDVAVAGGAENMSRALHAVPSLRWGQRMGDGGAIDMMIGALTDPFGNGHMGITAENVAALHGITREQQDAFSVESHRRAGIALAEGYFRDQILPIAVRKGRETVQFDQDEHVRSGVTLEDLAKLRTAFKKDGTVTAGNASSLNDGAAAVVLAERSALARMTNEPLARIVSYGHSGVAPEIMGMGPVDAVRLALKRAGLSINDIDIVESNEAFAAQACAVAQELGFDPQKTNPNGGAVALGHPISATGALLLVKLAYELRRTGGRYGLVTMCIGGGQGIALIIERA